jgi:hypothetical protein
MRIMGFCLLSALSGCQEKSSRVEQRQTTTFTTDSAGIKFVQVDGALGRQ